MELRTRRSELRRPWAIEEGIPLRFATIALLASTALLAAATRSDAALQGVDVYNGQGVINWTSVKNAGIRFGFVKATEGVDFVDARFATNMNAAIAAGIPVGPYHFARTNSGESTVLDPTPNPDAVAEANDFCDAIQGYYTSSTSGLVLRPVLDMEQLPDSPIAPYTNKTYTSKWSKDFSNVVQTRIGVTPIIYTSGNFAQNYYDSSFSTSPLWFAKPITPTPGDPSDSAFQNNMNNVSAPDRCSDGHLEQLCVLAVELGGCGQRDFRRCRSRLFPGHHATVGRAVCRRLVAGRLQW